MYEKLRSILLRKGLHITLCFVLLVPYTQLGSSIGIDPLAYYALLAAAAATLNAYQIKRSLLISKISVKAILDRFSASLTTIPEVASIMLRVEKLVEDLLRDVEREYERRSGYVGLTFGAIGTLTSYALFADHTLLGVLALMVVDPIAAVVGYKWGRLRIGENRRSIEGSVAAAASYLMLLVALGYDLPYSLILSIVASLTEAISVEDNLLIPLVVSAASYALYTLSL